jgi:ABC-type phosphate transport system permease subunit
MGPLEDEEWHSYYHYCGLVVIIVSTLLSTIIENEIATPLSRENWFYPPTH